MTSALVESPRRTVPGAAPRSIRGPFLADPLGFAAGDVNVSRYVGNGPTNATDPTGHVKLFGQEFVAPWSDDAGGFGDTLSGWSSAVGVAGTGVINGAVSGFGAGAIAGATIGVMAGGVTAEGTIPSGMMIGAVVGGASGFFDAVSADDAADAARRAMKSGAISGFSGAFGTLIGPALGLQLSTTGQLVVAGSTGVVADGAVQGGETLIGDRDQFDAGQSVINGLFSALGVPAQKLLSFLSGYSKQWLAKTFGQYIDDLCRVRGSQCTLHVPKVRGVPTNIGPFSSKAPRVAQPGIREIEGHYVDDLGRVQPWRAHYDEYGRMIGRTDYNAGNQAAGIPDVHYERWEYDSQFPLGRKVENHVPGEFPQ